MQEPASSPSSPSTEHPQAEAERSRLGKHVAHQRAMETRASIDPLVKAGSDALVAAVGFYTKALAESGEEVASLQHGVAQLQNEVAQFRLQLHTTENSLAISKKELLNAQLAVGHIIDRVLGVLGAVERSVKNNPAGTPDAIIAAHEALEQLKRDNTLARDMVAQAAPARDDRVRAPSPGPGDGPA